MVARLGARRRAPKVTTLNTSKPWSKPECGDTHGFSEKATVR
jgi:hypothetical protein